MGFFEVVGFRIFGFGVCSFGFGDPGFSRRTKVCKLDARRRMSTHLSTSATLENLHNEICIDGIDMYADVHVRQQRKGRTDTTEQTTWRKRERDAHIMDI